MLSCHCRMKYHADWSNSLLTNAVKYLVFFRAAWIYGSMTLSPLLPVCRWQYAVTDFKKTGIYSWRISVAWWIFVSCIGNHICSFLCKYITSRCLNPVPCLWPPCKFAGLSFSRSFGKSTFWSDRERRHYRLSYSAKFLRLWLVLLHHFWPSR